MNPAREGPGDYDGGQRSGGAGAFGEISAAEPGSDQPCGARAGRLSGHAAGLPGEPGPHRGRTRQTGDKVARPIRNRPADSQSAPQARCNRSTGISGYRSGEDGGPASSARPGRRKRLPHLLHPHGWPDRAMGTSVEDGGIADHRCPRGCRRAWLALDRRNRLSHLLSLRLHYIGWPDRVMGHSFAGRRAVSLHRRP